MNYGDLHDYNTGDCIRPATADDLRRSLQAASDTCDGQGVFKLDGRAVYVEGEDNEAHVACGGHGLAE